MAHNRVEDQELPRFFLFTEGIDSDFVFENRLAKSIPHFVQDLGMSFESLQELHVWAFGDNDRTTICDFTD